MFNTRPNRNKYKCKPEQHTCNICGIEQPFTEVYFGKHKALKFGLLWVCKVCEKNRKATQTRNSRSAINAVHRRWSKKNKEAGKCTRCNSPQLATSNCFCEKHYLQDVAHKALGSKRFGEFLKYLFEEQEHKCYYTGKELVLGINASIDHIKNQKHNPELKHSLENVVWADLEINRMKREHSEQKFIELCSLVTEYSKRVQRPL